MADEELVRLIREEGTAGLEKWREQNPDTIPDLESANLAGARLWEAHLEGANLRRAHLEEAHLEGARLEEAHMERANLREAHLEGAHLEWARLEGARLECARLEGANLWGAYLEGADLWGAYLEGADLRRARLKGARLWRAHMEGADLNMCELQRADFRGADLRGAKFHGVLLEHTQMERVSLGRSVGDELAGDYGEARDAYLRLKQNFENLGEYSAASWAYKKERQMEKFCSAPWNARRFHGRTELGDTKDKRLNWWHPRVWWFYIRHTGKWIADGSTEYLCGFGENPWWVLGWIALLVLLSASLYRVTGGVLAADPNSGDAVALTNPWDSVFFALASLVTMEGNYLGPASPTIAAWAPQTQAAIGIFLVGLLGFVAGNKIRRS